MKVHEGRLEAMLGDIMSSIEYGFAPALLSIAQGLSQSRWRRLTMDSLPPYVHNSNHIPVSGIYAITNTFNGNQYIGRAFDVQQRWYRHKLHLSQGNHHSPALQNAWNKYGPEIFECILLERVDSKIDLPAREQHYFDTLKPEYNILPEASSWLGMKHTDESRARMSLSGRGRKMPDGFGQKMSEINKGRKRSEDFSQALSERTKGRKHSEEAKEKNRLAHKGKVASEETRAKMSKAQTGRKHKPETIAKITSHHIGVKRSPEAVENIRQGQLNRERKKSDGT